MSIFFPEDEGREVPNVNNQPILRTEIIAGEAGPTGSQGPAGPVGPGVVTGGFTGQVLAKKTNADYDTEWITGGGGGGSAIWGGIAGTLSNQTDLQTVLDAKLSSVTWGSITGTLANQTDLQSALDAKALKITAITAGTGLTGGGDLSASRTISMLADVPADSLNFNTAATETNAIGKMFWNSTEGAPQVGLAGGNVQLQMGSMLVAYVRNAEATTLNKGEVVYLFGATGNRASVKRASNVADSSSSKTIGLVAESIGANQNGFIITQGVLDGLSLGSPYVSGDSIYLDTTPGAFTRVKPTQPDHIVFIGVVERANAGNGQLYIRPQNGFELEELHDVLITSPQNNQTILWNSATTLWVNSTLTIGTISGLSADLIGKAETTDIQIFTTTGSWTKPTGAKVINIQLLAGGGGGGGGFKNVTSTNRSGGAGGGGGGCLSANIPAQLLPETPISITIGAGGLGGSGSTNSGVTGGAGVLGGATIFGSGASGEITYIATGGASGGGGSGAASAVGFGSLNANSGGQGNIGNGAVGQPSAANSNHFMGGAGGGGAGGINNSNATSTGLNGGRSNLLNLTGGASNGGAGQNNTNAVNGLFAVGSGGGGGNSSRTVDGTSGGNGGFPSSGGGGGGASEAGNGGAGGTGGAGMAIITTYF